MINDLMLENRPDPGRQREAISVNCPNCGHPESDHGPQSGRWEDKATGKWDVVIPGRMCFHSENKGYSQDLCGCPGFDAIEDTNYFDTILIKAGLL